MLRAFFPATAWTWLAPPRGLDALRCSLTGQGRAALLGVLILVLLASLSLRAQDAAKEQKHTTAPTGLRTQGAGHLPMPTKPFTLPADHPLRLVSCGIDPVYKDLLGLRTNGWLGSDVGESMAELFTEEGREVYVLRFVRVQLERNKPLTESDHESAKGLYSH